VSTCGHVSAPVAPCAHLHRTCPRLPAHAWLQLASLRHVRRTALAAAARSQRFTCQAVASVVSYVRSASRHGSATQAERATCVIISCALRPVVYTAMCETLSEKWHLLRTREHVSARVCTCGTLCAPLSASVHAWLQMAWLRHAQRCSSQCIRGAGFGHCQAVASITSSVHPALGTARSAVQRIKTSCALRQLVQCGCAKSSRRRHLLCTREHPCAPVRTRGNLCAPARASAHAWLQLACSAVVRAVIPQRVRGASPARPSPASRATFGASRNAYGANTARYKQLRGAPARSQCNLQAGRRPATTPPPSYAAACEFASLVRWPAAPRPCRAAWCRVPSSRLLRCWLPLGRVGRGAGACLVND
jgi:hypothetical protein